MAVAYGDGKLYLFRGDSYHTWNPAKQVVGRQYWFFRFRQGWCALYPFGNGRVAKDYPQVLTRDWPALSVSWVFSASP
jgi:hypothetical protein